MRVNFFLKNQTSKFDSPVLYSKHKDELDMDVIYINTNYQQHTFGGILCQYYKALFTGLQ
jgi:hypothetical protein